jgi:hypothetical protein
MLRTRLLAPIVAAPLVLAAAAPAAFAAVNWQVPLTHGAGFPTATGSAQYQAQPGQRELQIEVDHVRALAGQRVSFWANGVRFGSAIVSTRGVAQIDRNTELGQAVPKIVHGSGVAVRSAAGAKVASGRF